MAARYTPGHTEAVTEFMAQRTAASHAAFVLPHLRPGLSILDIGCGPGSITVDLAGRVPDGSVLGIDMNAGQVARARDLARATGVDNVTFAVMNLEALQLSRSTFDLVLAHAVFEHLAAPGEVLAAMVDLARPGGIIALRSPDWGGFVVHPEPPPVTRAMAAYQDLQRGNGGDVRAGRQLAHWLEAAGLALIQRSASYQIYEDASEIADYLAGQLGAAGQPEAADALRSWALTPGALFAQAWFEAIGRRPPG